MEKIKLLQEKTGCGILECKNALKYCNNDIDVAFLFLKLYSQSVARYKIIDNKKVKWEIEDYVLAAKKELNI